MRNEHVNKQSILYEHNMHLPWQIYNLTIPDLNTALQSYLLPYSSPPRRQNKDQYGILKLKIHSLTALKMEESIERCKKNKSYKNIMKSSFSVSVERPTLSSTATCTWHFSRMHCITKHN